MASEDEGQVTYQLLERERRRGERGGREGRGIDREKRERERETEKCKEK